MPFILETNSDAIVAVGPDFLDQFVIQLLGPFALQELDDLLAALNELAAVAPAAVLGIGEGHGRWILAVPGILSHACFLDGRFEREGRERGLAAHDCW